MITSADCYIKDSCKKYKENPNCGDGAEFCMRLFKIDTMFNNALLTSAQKVPKKLVIVDSDPLQEDNNYNQLNDILRNIEMFVTNGKNLYLHSPMSGNGKTSWALKLLHEYFRRVWVKADLSRCQGLFINVPRFLLALKDNISEKNDYITFIKNNVFTADLVIWDDIATKGATDFEKEHLLSLIDTRINAQKSNIFTSNVQDAAMYDSLGPRLASRIVNLSTNITLLGVDKRYLAKESSQ